MDKHSVAIITSAESIPVSEVTDINKASSIFVSNLFNKHAWPSISMKHPMIIEAFQQLNAMAKREDHDMKEIVSVMTYVCHANSSLCTKKQHILNIIL